MRKLDLAAWLLGLSFSICVSGGVAQAGLISGQPARDLFEDAAANAGYTKVTFTYAANTKLSTWIPGLTFATFKDANGNPTSQPVNVSGFSGRTGTIVGTPCSSCSDDGRYAYRVVFSTPQQGAGIQRNWNQWSRTRFYAADGSLLGETEGSGYFAFFVDDPNDTDSYVQRIEMDGVSYQGSIQVGYSDDLIYGLGAIPEPGTALLLGAGVVALAGLRRRA